MLRNRKLSAILLLLSFACGSCFTSTASFSRNPDVSNAALNNFIASKPSVKPENIKFLRNPPEQEFVVLGTLKAAGPTLKEKMRKKAAAIGADAILDFKSKREPYTYYTIMQTSPNPLTAIQTAHQGERLVASGKAIIYVSGEQKKFVTPAIQAALAKKKAFEERQAMKKAIEEGHSEVVKALLAQGADVNAKDNNWTTALVLASHRGHSEVVKALLAQGVDVNAKNIYGTTALKNASINGHSEVVKILKEAGARK